MAKPKLPRPKLWPALTEAVEQGVAYGLRRAHKHTDAPSEETIREEIERAVLNEICCRFDLE